MFLNYFVTLVLILCLAIPTWATISRNETLQYDSPDLYVRLGVTRSASSDEIKKEYRKLAQKFHPDRNLGNEKEAEEIFKKIKEAYDLLSDTSKKSDYDRVLNEGFIKTTDNPSSQDDSKVYDKVRRELEKIAAQFPELDEMIFNVLRRDIYHKLSEQITVKEIAEKIRNYEPEFHRLYKHNLESVIRKGYYTLPFERVHVWPTDTDIVKKVLATNNPYLIRELMASVMNLPGWSEQEAILHKIILFDIPMVNKYIAEFLYTPQWVNPVGARLLERLIRMGYSDQAARALGLAGSMIQVDSQGKQKQNKGWHELPEGLYLMKLLFVHADDHILNRVESFQLMNESYPWVKALYALPEFRKLPYLGMRTIKPVVQSLKMESLLQGMSIENLCLSILQK